jgi:hypothetical protein
MGLAEDAGLIISPPSSPIAYKYNTSLKYLETVSVDLLHVLWMIWNH